MSAEDALGRWRARLDLTRAKSSLRTPFWALVSPPWQASKLRGLCGTCDSSSEEQYVYRVRQRPAYRGGLVTETERLHYWMIG